MIRCVQLDKGHTASVMVCKGRKGVHQVEIWTPKRTFRCEVNKRDLPEGCRRKEDIMNFALAKFKEQNEKG